jgi:probable F420-dependent oxidoreductase
MNRPYRFAIQTGPFDDPDALAAFATKIEGLGYDELYSYDHIGLRGNTAVDPFLPLVVAARATSRLRVGPLVLNNEFHHPALLARTALSADQMTSGRLVLGLGTGYSQEEHDAIGLELRAPGPRVSRFEESLIVLRQLIDSGSCRLDGRFHQIDVETMGLAPVQERMPFLIGGHGRRVVTLAGQHADIFQFTGLTHAEDGTPSGGGFAIEQVDQRAAWLADAAGDRNDRIERSALVQVTGVGDDAPTVADLVDRFKLDADIIANSPFVLCGSTEQVIDKIERLRERLGITHFVVRDPEDFAPIVAALR